MVAIWTDVTRRSAKSSGGDVVGTGGDVCGTKGVINGIGNGAENWGRVADIHRGLGREHQGRMRAVVRGPLAVPRAAAKRGRPTTARARRWDPGNRGRCIILGLHNLLAQPYRVIRVVVYRSPAAVTAVQTNFTIIPTAAATIITLLLFSTVVRTRHANTGCFSRVCTHTFFSLRRIYPTKTRVSKILSARQNRQNCWYTYSAPLLFFSRIVYRKCQTRQIINKNTLSTRCRGILTFFYWVGKIKKKNTENT